MKEVRFIKKQKSPCERAFLLSRFTSKILIAIWGRNFKLFVGQVRIWDSYLFRLSSRFDLGSLLSLNYTVNLRWFTQLSKLLL